ncbi:hypothetical protein F5Y12DRAFT_215031 [Xylaria sp. FL1777]|nr:hypothetical protein F5Y12DRAFT_215031 [Xylaria sp. FL1777]
MDSEMDSVEKLFAALTDPYRCDLSDNINTSLKDSAALHEFVKDPPSQDPDYPYLITHAQKAVGKRGCVVSYFHQQLAHLAVQKQLSRRDKSNKARQLRYHGWFARGMKAETFPFDTKSPESHPSTTRIAAIVSSKNCAACGKSGANMRCPDCAFSDDGHVLEKTSYCNKACLQKHHNAHKNTCECRRMVYRATLLLELIFVAMEEATYIYPVSKTYKKNGLIYLIDDNWDRNCMTGRRLFTPFPKHLAESADVQRAMLVWSQAEEIMLSLFSMTKYLFKPFCKNMELAVIQPRNVITPVCHVSNGRAVNICFSRHTVLKLTLMSNEQYVIDLAGAQFGWKETLAPWAVWNDLRTITTELKSFKPASSRVSVPIQKSVLEAEQLERRRTLVKSIVNELETALPGNSSHPSLDKLLKSSVEDYERVQYDIMEIVRQKIYLLITNECYKNTYRIWMTGGPDYKVQLAKEHSKVLKHVWITGKEYDRLKKSGIDMGQMWTERIDAKFKQRTTPTDVASTEKSSHAHEALKEQ